MEHMTYSGNARFVPYQMPATFATHGHRPTILAQAGGIVTRLARCILGLAEATSGGSAARAGARNGT
eukprot:11209645-Lingulodinium_polyedra.AAC.1